MKNKGFVNDLINVFVASLITFMTVMMFIGIGVMFNIDFRTVPYFILNVIIFFWVIAAIKKSEQ